MAIHLPASAVIHRRCVGLDVNQETVEACVRLADGDDVHHEVRIFDPTARDLTELAEWLAARNCTHVAMEAAGANWQPAWHALEGRFEIVLADAQQVRQVPGREPGVNDAVWLADLLAFDLIGPLGDVEPVYREEFSELASTPAQTPLTIGTVYSERDTGATPIRHVAAGQIRRRAARIVHALRGLTRRQDAKSPPPGQSSVEIGELATRLISRLEEIATRVDAIDERTRELDAIEFRILALTNAANHAERIAQRLIGADGDLQKHYEAVQHLSTQVLQAKALEEQQHTVKHALVQARRVKALVRSMDIQMSRLDERMTQVGRAEDAIRRTETLTEDASDCLRAAIGLNEEIRRETADLEANSMVLLKALHDEVATLSHRKQEFETIDEGVRSLTTAVGDVQSRLNTLVAKDKELIAVTEKIEALSTALVEEGAQKATRLEQSVGELDNRLTRIAAYVPLAESLEERLMGLQALSTDVDQRIQEQIARRAELETLRRVFDGVAAEQQVKIAPPGTKADRAMRVVRPLAFAAVAVAVIGAEIAAGFLIARWAGKQQVAGTPPSQTTSVAPPAEQVHVAVDHDLPGDSRLAILARANDRSLQKQRALSRTTVSPLPGIYSDDDLDVSRPVPIRQELPPWPRPRGQALQAATVVNEMDFLLPSTASGLLEVVIGPDGRVESAIMLVPIHPFSDRSVTGVARRWRYRPALKQGQPVRYKKAIRVLLR